MHPCYVQAALRIDSLSLDPDNKGFLMICFVLLAYNCHWKVWMKDAASDSCTQTGNIPCSVEKHVGQPGKGITTTKCALACQSLGASRAKNPAAWIVWGRWDLGWGWEEGLRERGTFVIT